MGLGTFLLIGLVLWRVSKMITDEDGPFDFFSWLRSKIPQSNWVGRGVRCLWCISFWLGLGLGVSIGVQLEWSVGEMLLYGLSWSSVAILIDERGIRHEGST